MKKKNLEPIIIRAIIARNFPLNQLIIGMDMFSKLMFTKDDLVQIQSKLGSIKFGMKSEFQVASIQYWQMSDDDELLLSQPKLKIKNLADGRYQNVIRNYSKTTPLREVFSGSFGFKSLKNVLWKGVATGFDLPNHLIRFKRFIYGLITDISKAFLHTLK